MHLREMLATLSSAEITEQLAASALQDRKWREELAEEVEADHIASLPVDERVKIQRAILRGRA